jgi:hypothetical protein
VHNELLCYRSGSHHHHHLLHYHHSYAVIDLLTGFWITHVSIYIYSFWNFTKSFNIRALSLFLQLLIKMFSHHGAFLLVRSMFVIYIGSESYTNFKFFLLQREGKPARKFLSYILILLCSK